MRRDHPTHPSVAAFAADLRARGLTSLDDANLAAAASFHEPFSDAFSHEGLHEGSGYAFLESNATLVASLVHLDEFKPLFTEYEAAWQCGAAPSGATNVTAHALLLQPRAGVPPPTLSDAVLVLGFLLARLQALDAFLSWGPALLGVHEDPAALAPLWGSGCGNPALDPYFLLVPGSVRLAASGAASAVTILFDTRPAKMMDMFDTIKHNYRFNPNLTEAMALYPDVPLYARDGTLLASSAGAAPAALRRQLALSPDPTATGTGNQVIYPYTVGNYDWNYKSPGVATIDPVPLSKTMPATMFGCSKCYFHAGLTAYGSLDFCNPYGSASCYVSGFSSSVYLREMGAYLEGTIDVRGTVAVTNPSFPLPTTSINLLAKTALGSFTFTVCGMPITIYCYLTLNMVLGGSVTVYGRWAMSASYVCVLFFFALRAPPPHTRTPLSPRNMRCPPTFAGFTTQRPLALPITTFTTIITRANCLRSGPRPPSPPPRQTFLAFLVAT